VNRFVNAVYNYASLLQSVLYGGVITMYLALIVTTVRIRLDVRERGVPDTTLSTGDSLPTRIQILLMDHLATGTRTRTP
jgi:hypothetical protein